MNQWPSELKIFATADGSPTLAMARSDGYVEKMHHSGGALSESLYIYHSALSEAVLRNWPIKVLSFGLGCAYNEWITLAEMHAQGRRDFELYSFESNDFLKEQFRRLLMGEPLDQTYAELINSIVIQISQHFRLSAESLIDFGKQTLVEGRLKLLGPYPECSPGITGATVIYYDAFSNKMDAEPWSEESLKRDLAPLIAPECVLSTYAKTGAMNRALKKLGFRLLERAGFLGKRESTLAIRDEVR